MAKILHLASGAIIYLLPYHKFGRHQDTADTLVVQDGVSRIHCTIEWDGVAWSIRDHSRNGTWLLGKRGKGERLPALLNSVLAEGQQLAFTSAANAQFKILDLAPPKALLVNQQLPEQTLLLEDAASLPSAVASELTVVCESMVWRVNYGGGKTTELKHGDVIALAGSEWQAFIPCVMLETKSLAEMPVNAISHIPTQLFASRNGEHVSVSFDFGDGNLQHLKSSAQFELLGYLAAKRLDDANIKVPSKDQGWVNNAIVELESQLDESHLNIIIYRIRKLIAKGAPSISDPENIIERRRGQIRLGISASCLQLELGAGSA